VAEHERKIANIATTRVLTPVGLKNEPFACASLLNLPRSLNALSVLAAGH
jgi:hypothetical protein